MTHFLILRVVGKLLMPFILLFALYVQFHGDFGPGGGFQAGIIFAVAFILYALLYGVDLATKVVPEWVARWGLAAGLLIFAVTGLLGLVRQSEYLNYSILRDTPVAGEHLGITLVEFGVGVTVASAMISIFFAFTKYRS